MWFHNVILTCFSATTQVTQEDIKDHKEHLKSLSSLAQSMSEASPQTSAAIVKRLSQLEMEFDALQKRAEERNKALVDGLARVSQ